VVEEKIELRFADEDTWWAWAWSQGMRHLLERDHRAVNDERTGPTLRIARGSGDIVAGEFGMPLASLVLRSPSRTAGRVLAVLGLLHLVSPPTTV